MDKMLKFVLIGLSAMTGCTIVPTIASTQDLRLRVGLGGIGAYDRERDNLDRQDHRRGCSPEDALDAARAEGLRRAQIVRIFPRSIVV